MPTAIDRPDYIGSGTADMAAHFTRQRQQNPAFRAPDGYKWKGDHYERDTRTVWDRIGQVSAAAGIGAMGIGGLGLAGIGPAAGAAAGAAGPSIASGVPAGLPGAVSGLGGSAGGSMAGGLTGWLSNPSNWLDLAGSLGGVLGKSAAGAAEGRHVDALLSNQRDALRTQQYGTAQDAEFGAGALDLNRKQFEEQARSGRARQAAIGNLLSNLQDVSLNVPGVESADVTGGLRASALGPGGRAAGGELAKQAMLKLLQPDEFTGGQLLTPPPMTPIPEVSMWEKLAGIGGLAGSLGGALGSAGRPRQLTSTVAPRG